MDVDKTTVWNAIKDWPSACLAELALRIHNKLHIRREHADLRRTPSVYAQQIQAHDNPHDVGPAPYERKL